MMCSTKYTNNKSLLSWDFCSLTDVNLLLLQTTLGICFITANNPIKLWWINRTPPPDPLGCSPLSLILVFSEYCLGVTFATGCREREHRARVEINYSMS